MTQMFQVHPHDPSDLGNVRSVGVAANVGYHTLMDLTNVQVLMPLDTTLSDITRYCM